MIYQSGKPIQRELADLAAQQGGYFTAKQAAALGYDRRRLAYHVDAGNFERAGHGLYRIATLPFSEHDDLLRLWFWSRGRDDKPQGVFSHQTALALHDLAEFIPNKIHMTVPRTFRKKRPKGCVLHKESLASDNFHEFSAFTVTTLLRTLEDLAGIPGMPREQFEQAVTEAVSRGLIRKSQASHLLSQRKGI